MLEDIPLPVQIRLRTIEVLLVQYGFVNRSVLCELFGLADAAVSKDISLYKNLNKDGCFYNRSSRRIEKLLDFKRIFNKRQSFKKNYAICGLLDLIVSGF